ncbi:MAG: hypothetical protein VKJ02_08365 [Snowella sp.]|nr:hypothetical protein [Snowella sp.]
MVFSKHPFFLQIRITNLSLEFIKGLTIWQSMELLKASESRLQIVVTQAGEPDLQLTLQTETHHAQILEGLQAWSTVGLLQNAQIICEVTVNADHPQLLTGIDHWLNLGLITEADIKKQVAAVLNSPLPEPVRQPPRILATPSSPFQFQEEEEALSPLLPEPSIVPVAPNPRPPSKFSQITQSLLAELSVFWLLLLGVFMVVISSGVLAASQWQRFPATGQYGILWFYTLGFCGASVWATRQSHLRLTSQALRIITLLLIPVNFVAMDSFQLWNSWLGCFLMAIAAGSLTFLAQLLLNSGHQQRWLLLNFLGLSYLQWGWAMAGIPWVASYLGIVGSSGMALYRWGKHTERTESRLLTGNLPFSFNGALIVYGLCILFIRAIFFVQLPLPQLGLAIALAGTFIAWQVDSTGDPRSTELFRHRLSSLSDWLGGGLIALGWLVSVWGVPWQGLMSSLLGAGFLTRRLYRYQKSIDLVALWLIGLQLFWVGWRLLPESLQTAAIALGQQLTGLDDQTFRLLSVVLLPYLALTVTFINVFEQQHQSALAKTTRQVALIFGIFLALMSLTNASLRTINVAGSTLLLIHRTQNAALTQAENPSETNQSAQSLAFYSHCGVLLSLGCLINWLFPQMTIGHWAILSLELAVLEMLWSIQPLIRPRWLGLMTETAQSFSLGLAAIAYGLFGIHQMAAGLGFTLLGQAPIVPTIWGLLWGLIPLSWTAIAVWIPTQRPWASRVGIWASVIWQGLTLFYPVSRWLGLGSAALFLLVNTAIYPTQFRAIISLGGVIGFCVSGLEVAQLISIQRLDHVLMLAIALMGLLWGLRHWLTYRSTILAGLYQNAADVWAYSLTGLTVGLLPFLYPVLVPNWIGFTGLGLMGLTAYRSLQAPLSPTINWFNIGMVIITQIFLWSVPVWNVVGLVIALGVMVGQTYRLASEIAAFITVGIGLALEIKILQGFTPRWFSAEGLLISAMTAIALWGLRDLLRRQARLIGDPYVKALDIWGVGCCGLALGGLTLHSLFLYQSLIPASVIAISAAVLTLLALAYRTALQPRNEVVYALAWAVELLTLEILGWAGRSLVALAIANIVLGLVTQWLGDWWQRRSEDRLYLSSFHILPLLYGALGASLRWGLFTRWTGLTTLGLVLIALGVGRRRPGLKPLLYLALIGVSVSAYELLLYQVAGLAMGDQLLALAALTTGILYAYRLLAPWLKDYLNFTDDELNGFAHIHWFIGSVFVLMASVLTVQINAWIGIGAGLFLTRYALWQGRDPDAPEFLENWTYWGIGQAIALLVYGSYLIPFVRDLGVLLFPYWGFITSIAGMVIYGLPWATWQWSVRPWRQLAIALPLGGLLPNLQGFYPFNYLAIAGFYGGLAFIRQQPRLSYFSLLLVDIAVLHALENFKIQIPFLYGLIIGLSLFYIAWCDPFCKTDSGFEVRHLIRLMGTGAIGLTALVFHFQPGIYPSVSGLILIFAGLGLRIRAFLFGGTVIFIAIVFYQLIILVLEYSLLKWIIGLLMGLGFIWIAATFETRREQLSYLIRNWLRDLEEWE